MASSNPLEDCTIVWLCPLEVELQAALAMLDMESHEVCPRSPGQNVIYTVGTIGPHKVAVVGYYQEQGLAASGGIVTEVKRDLPKLQFGLLVGIAGGIPSAAHDIQLGDVAVAVPENDCPGVVGYDLGKEREDGHFELKHWQNSTDPMLRSAIGIVRARNPERFKRHLEVVESRTEFRRPNLDLSDLTSARPRVHYGIILSGNTVIKSKAKRDQLRSQYGGIAVEMEAAGMMTRLPVAVIRGISDFADASKNKEWQPYAAITAAAYAKEVLLSLPPEIQRHPNARHIQPPLNEPISTDFAVQDLRLAQVLPERWAFVGRTEEMAFLENELGHRSCPPVQKLVVGLWGLAGVGKTQLVARFVEQQRSSHPEREIFWLNCESQQSLEQSIISMLKPQGNIGTPGHNISAKSSVEERRRLLNIFQANLNSLENARWLLVVDGIVEISSSMETTFDIRGFIAGLTRGCILVTSRRRDVVARYYPCQQVKGLKINDAMDLLRQQITPRPRESEMENLAALLHGLPLALRLATSVITQYRCTVDEYIETWRGHGPPYGISGTDDSLSQSMALSFDELEKNEPIAAKILTLFSYLHHRDFWFELCHNGGEDIYPNWLQDIARERVPFMHFCPILADLSFIELRNSSASDRGWVMHPVVQMVAIQRARDHEQEYIRSAIALVASQVPRSFEENSWEIIRRLWPHAEMCWNYIKQGRWGPNTDYTDLESLARVFRRIGRYEEASLIYQKIDCELDHHPPTRENSEFLADVLTNLGLVYTRQWRFDLALGCIERSSQMMTQLGIMTPDVSFSFMYNIAVVFMMTGRLDEAEAYLRRAAAHFSRESPYESDLSAEERKELYIRILNDLGEVRMQQGAVEEALSLFYHVRDDPESSNDGFHPTSIALKLSTSRALSKLDRFSEARSLLVAVIDVYTQWWGRRHLETMRVIEELAFVLVREFEQKRILGEGGGSEIRMADQLWHELLAFYRSVDGDDSEGVARIRGSLHFLSV
ncbi:hypothetical protein N7492_008220 [Penicillium capsulatum]|uniref:Nucleoside phosphorylase domain-containing protein n=1 Tax=Penicillium capsulatum TaxID=69766 RepID=A0A9W9HRB0_9EURO|nr:hypothetical protein N7492_008220 [Penicillium capsulatum]KAJ6105630.1 hypothetical protein N7512_009147 [Penicillium capsulatum]